MSADSFAFSEENITEANRAIARYPDGRQASAVLALLDLAQRQNGNWLPRTAIEYVSDYLQMPRIRVMECATFYSMFNLSPVGRHFVQLCRTTPCWLRGYEGLLSAYREETGGTVGETTEDGMFTLVEVECLGGCCNAPMVQIGDCYYEDLTPENFKKILRTLAQGATPKPGSQVGRTGAEPAGGQTTLTGSGGA